MNKSSTVIIALVSLVFVACGQSDAAKQDHQAEMTQDHSAMMDHQQKDGEKGAHKMEMVDSKAHTMVQLSTIQCDNCKLTIETGLAGISGIEFVNVDVEKKMAHINYDATKLSNQDIELAISKLGYQANDLPADSLAYANLSECCQVKD